MPTAVAADIGHAGGIVAPKATHAVLDGLLPLRLDRHHGAEEDADRRTRGRRASAVTTATAMMAVTAMAAAATSAVRTVLHLDQQRCGRPLQRISRAGADRGC